jgi:hypothetical protein
MRSHEHERRHETERPERAPEPPRAGLDVLALQRSAGNQAVAAMLARQPVAEETKGGTEKQAGIGTVTLAGIGVIPIISFGSGDRGTGAPTTEYTFTSHVGPHSTKLIQAFSKATPMDGEVDVQGFKLKLSKAMVSSYRTVESQGETVETWTVIPESAHVDDGSGGGGGGGGNDRPPWDQPYPG